MILWLLTIGVASMLGQVVLLRELNVAFYGSELIYILALGFWMLWTAVGASLGRRSHVASGGQVRLLLVAFAAVLPAVAVLIRELRRLSGGVPGAYLPFPHQLLGMAGSLLPVGLLLGLQFQWAAKRYVRVGGPRRTLAIAYAIESAGGLVGGAAATLLLMAGVSNLAAALLCALLSLAAALFPWRRERPRWLPAAAAVAAAGILPGLWFSGAIDRHLTARNHPGLVATADSPYGRVTLTETAGQIVIFDNDVLAFESEGTAAEEFVHLAALQHPAPRTALVLGGVVEGMIGELRLHGVERIDAVELNPVVLDLAMNRLPGPVRSSLSAAGVRIHVADPRRFVATDVDTYDLILIGMPEPSSGQTNRFYTREFFRLCAARMGRNGVLALRLRGAENLWSPLLLRRTASIVGALGSAFADVEVLPGTIHILLASNRELSDAPGILGNRLVERGIEGRVVIPQYIDYLYTNDRFGEMRELMSRRTAPVNSDLRPICYQYTMLLWLSRFFPSLTLRQAPELEPARLARSPWGWLTLAGLGGLVLIARRSMVGRRALLVGCAGLVGMVLETALLLNYQTVRGVLYQDLGVLLTLFMAGLALGSIAVDRLERPEAPGYEAWGRWIGPAIVASLGLLSLLTGWLLSTGGVRGLASTGPLLLACGALVAAAFAHGCLHGRPDPRRVLSPLYSADLIGGCLGSVAASLLLVPVLGLAGSAVLMIVVVVLAAMVL